MRVDVEVGVTLRIGKRESNQYLKMSMGFRDIDPDLPLEEQLQAAADAATVAVNRLLQEIRRRVREAIDAARDR